MTSFNINELPPELICRIFSYLTVNELLQRVAPVCRLWYDFANDPVLWHTLIFVPTLQCLTSDVLRICFERAPLLHRLDVCGPSQKRDFRLSTDDLRCCSRLCPNVQDLRIECLSYADFGFIDEVVGIFPNLKCLSISACEHDSSRCSIERNECYSKVKHADNLQCISRICDLVNLRTLDISYCDGIKDDALDVISSHLLHLENLNADGVNHITDA